MGFLAVVLALLNVPGQVVVDSLVSDHTHSYDNGWYVHGWPLTALRRGPFFLGLPQNLWVV